MLPTIDDIVWNYAKGNELNSKCLQNICLFRSYVLYDFGFRKNFGSSGTQFGDIQYSDFDSFHIVASIQNQIVGTIRVTPPTVDNVTCSIFGKPDYQKLIQQIGSELKSVYEINRLMVEPKFRNLNLGRNLIYAAVGLIESQWNRNLITIIGSAGNCTKQTDFVIKNTDFQKIPEIDLKNANDFNDTITVLKYGIPPYKKGSDNINNFKNLFSNEISKIKLTDELEFNYQLLNEANANDNLIFS